MIFMTGNLMADAQGWAGHQATKPENKTIDVVLGARNFHILTIPGQAPNSMIVSDFTGSVLAALGGSS